MAQTQAETTAPARPLLRQTTTVHLPGADPAATDAATLQLVILDEGGAGWEDLPESREAGWMNVYAGGLDIRIRVIA